MSIDGTPTTPEGWYPDPSGAPKSRWWDGTAWTEHYHDPSAPVDASPAAVGSATIAAPATSTGSGPYTLWLWIIIGLLAVSFLSLVTFDFQGYVLASAYSVNDPFAIFTPGYFLMLGVSFIAYWGTVALAFFDHKELKARGIVSPFHWAFAFISSLVYLVGRSIVLKRRIGSGMLPLWVSVGYVVACVIVVIVWVVSTIALITSISNGFS